MKDLLIFFDNQTFKLNNIVINYIKRWVIYKIINNYNQYDNIYILKTYPEFVEKKITISDINEDIYSILTCINNIIYKKYESYHTICLKDIFDFIDSNKNNGKKSYKDVILGKYDLDEILIITSITSYNNNLTDFNIKYINTILDKHKLNINLTNICGIKFINDLFPKINEETIDINWLKTENIPIYKMVGIPDIPTDSKPLYNLINLDSISILTKQSNGFEYLKLMYLMESLIIYNSQSNNKLTTDKTTTNTLLSGELGDIINSILDKIKIDKNDNLVIENIFKSYKNSIKDLLSRFSKLQIILPIDKLSKELSSSYIKYILEFYSIIYPKINYYNSLQKINKIHKNKHKNISNNTTDIKITKVKKFDIHPSDISCEYLTSSLTMTNWIEEYENANPFGFLIKYNPSKLSFKGILDVNSSILKTYPNMIINNITTNFVPLYDYYQIILFDYEENKENDDNNNDNQYNDEKKIFNISKFNIIDNVNGDGNVLLPLYINKHHWELTKSIWNYHISFINNCFEQEYNSKMDNIYFYSIIKFVNDLKNLNANSNIKKTIRLFTYLLRTCIQILIDNKFIHSIKNDYLKYVDLVLNLDSFNNNHIFSDFIVRLIQIIISSNIDENTLENDLNKITSYVFKKYIISKYKMDFWDKINQSNLSGEEKKNELYILKNDTIQENIQWVYLNFDIKIFYKIIKSIYSICGFNQFIKQIDKTNGCLEDIQENNKLNLDTIKEIIITNCSTQFDLIEYYKLIDISQYYIQTDTI